MHPTSARLQKQSFEKLLLFVMPAQAGLRAGMTTLPVGRVWQSSLKLMKTDCRSFFVPHSI